MDFLEVAIKLCFEDEVKKLKLFAFYLRLLICVLFATHLVHLGGWDFLQWKSINLNSIIDFFISGKAMIVALAFGISIAIVFYGYNLVIYILASILAFFRNTTDKAIRKKMLYYQMVRIEKKKLKKNDSYDTWYEILEYITEPKSGAIYSARVVNAIITGALYCYLIYPEIQILPHWIVNTMWSLAIFYNINICYLFYMRYVANDIKEFCDMTFEEESRKKTYVK
jgi:hypothetical protein